MAKAKISSKKREQLRKRLLEIEQGLKNLQTQFRDIKKRAGSAMEKSISQRDAREIEKIRKTLGLN